MEIAPFSVYCSVTRSKSSTSVSIVSSETLALCRLFAGDLDQALDHADNMERVAGFDIEHSFICGLVSSLRGENEKMLEYEMGIRRKDEKLSQVLRAIAGGARCGTFSDLARLLV